MHNAGVAINWWDFGNAEAPALGWYIITFVIFVALLIHFVRKPLKVYLEARALDIKNAIDEAKKAKEEANAKMAGYESRLAALDEEIKKLKSEFVTRGEQEKANFEKSAAHLAQQITKEAEENLVFEVRHALSVLKTNMADAVVAQAKAQLEASKDRATEAALRNVFNKGVSELHN